MRIFAVWAEDAIGAQHATQLAACFQYRPGRGSGASARGLRPGLSRRGAVWYRLVPGQARRSQPGDQPVL